jgi:hypothetical protein
MTKTEYTDFSETLKKFPVKCDAEFIRQMNKQLSALDKDHASVEPEKDFEIANMKFDKESKLRKVND